MGSRQNSNKLTAKHSTEALITSKVSENESETWLAVIPTRR